MRQVIDNVESTKRQYALRGRAVALGWHEDQIIGTGNVRLDPDTQIRDTIAHFLETFSRVGSACQTVKAVRREGLGFPSRPTGSATVFRPLTASTAIRVLSNPRSAGAYVYGRRRYRRGTEGKKHIVRKRDCGEWQACIPNAHPGYISWEQYQQSLKLLASNGRGYELARGSPPREGAALLQGRAVCDRCGISASPIAPRGASKRLGMSANAHMVISVTGTANP